jgi:hypothetical protein
MDVMTFSRVSIAASFIFIFDKLTLTTWEAAQMRDNRNTGLHLYRYTGIE